MRLAWDGARVLAALGGLDSSGVPCAGTSSEEGEASHARAKTNHKHVRAGNVRVRLDTRGYITRLAETGVRSRSLSSHCRLRKNRSDQILMLRYADPTQYALGALLRHFCVRIPGCPPMRCRQGAPHSEACSPRRTLNRRRRPTRAELSSRPMRKWCSPRLKHPCAHIFGHTRPHRPSDTHARAHAPMVTQTRSQCLYVCKCDAGRRGCGSRRL